VLAHSSSAGLRRLPGPVEDEDREAQGRQPTGARRVPRADHQRSRDGHVRGGGRGGTKNGNVVTGGQRITEGELGKGLFVEPTVVEAPDDSWIWKKELFVPFVAVAPSTSSTKRSGRPTRPSMD
jgi:hypothetical protein